MATQFPRTRIGRLWAPCRSATAVLTCALSTERDHGVRDSAFGRRESYCGGQCGQIAVACATGPHGTVEIRRKPPRRDTSVQEPYHPLPKPTGHWCCGWTCHISRAARLILKQCRTGQSACACATLIVRRNSYAEPLGFAAGLPRCGLRDRRLPRRCLNVTRPSVTAALPEPNPDGTCLYRRRTTAALTAQTSTLANPGNHRRTPPSSNQKITCRCRPCRTGA